MRLSAPAKINLHLRIGPPRADGFHPLLSWMATIGLFDSLTFSAGDPGIIAMTCNEPSLPCDDRNLVMKAAKLLRSEATHSAHIHLQKKIPHGGGLGGGSSDAAFTLLGLNRFWQLEKSVKLLDTFAAKLGSDINFFLHGSSSICQGRGELVRPIQTPVVARWVLLILPAIAMPTPAVYRRFDEMKLGSQADVDIEPDWDRWVLLPSLNLLPLLVNDLEGPAFAIKPELGKLRDAIETILERPARMSGSGSSLFTLYDEQSHAAAALNRIFDQSKCRAMVVELCPRETGENANIEH